MLSFIAWFDVDLCLNICRNSSQFYMIFGPCVYFLCLIFIWWHYLLICRFYDWFCSTIVRKEFMAINWSNVGPNLIYFGKLLGKKNLYVSLQRPNLDDSRCCRKIKMRSPTLLLITNSNFQRFQVKIELQVEK